MKPGQDHHPHGLTDPRPVVEFFEKVRMKVRHFRMGFTGFPHDISIEAVIHAREFSHQNADIIAHHIEGVPWAELLEDKPFSDELVNEWKGKKEATPKSGKVYLAISPGRGDLKPGEKSLPFPKELVGKSYDDPVVMRAYLSYCRRMLEFFKPDYLAIGIEVNEIYQAGPDKWRAYAALHRHVYQELKKDHPDLPIFASFTLHGMLNLTGRSRESMLRAFSEIMPFSDFVAVSFYPFIQGRHHGHRRLPTVAHGSLRRSTRSRMRSWKSGSLPSVCDSPPAVRSLTARRRSKRRSTSPCWPLLMTTMCGS